MLMPATASDAALSLEGWESSNFFALAVMLVQIPFVSLLHKWPFAGTSKQPTESLGVLAFSTLVTYIVWLALIVPSFLHFSIDGESVTSQSFGSWPAFVAFCQAFVIFSITVGCEMGCSCIAMRRLQSLWGGEHLFPLSVCLTAHPGCHLLYCCKRPAFPPVNNFAPNVYLPIPSQQYNYPLLCNILYQHG